VGWLFQEKPRDVRKYFWDKFHWETERAVSRPLDMVLKLHVCYAAIETVQKADGAREVWCAVYMLKYIRGESDPYNFGYKDLTDRCGPVVADCPARILDLLTETDHQTANEWRARCRRNLEKRMPKIGVTVHFDRPIQFSDGTEQTDFTVVRVGKRRKLLRGSNGLYYRIPRRSWRERSWMIVR